MEKPILFNGQMVRAILDGKKTQTRRVIKPQPEWVDHNIIMSWKGSVGMVLAHDVPYRAGDHLWVRETWAQDIPGCPHPARIAYRADHQDPKGDGPANSIKWKPSIFMPRWASRITLEVVSVRVERISDISGDDVLREGVDSRAYYSADYFESNQRDMFQKLWDSINKKRGFGWAVNPWVWVVSFKHIQAKS